MGNSKSNVLYEFFCEWKSFVDIIELFNYMDHFFQEQLNCDPLVVASCAVHDKSVNESHIRIVYDLHKEKQRVPQNGIRDLIVAIHQSEAQWQILDCEDNKFLCFKIGGEDHQKFFGIVPANNIELLSEAEMKYFFSFIKNGMKQHEEWENIQKLNYLVYTDDVTGLFNQRKLNQDLESYIDRYHNGMGGFSIFFIDIDHFKNVNDGNGHIVGTKLLAQFGRLLKDFMREGDLIYRYGGDEFVIILHNIATDTAKMLGERILAAVKKHKFKISDDKEIDLSVSIGVANFPEHTDNRDDILSLADRMMYEAKAGGRGQVCMADKLFKK